MARGKKSAQAAARRQVNAELDRDEALTKLEGERARHKQVEAELRSRLATLVSDFDLNVERQVAAERKRFEERVSDLDLELTKSRLGTWYFLATYLDFDRMGTEDAKKIADYIGIPQEFLLGSDRKELTREQRRLLGGGGYTQAMERFNKLRNKRLEERHG